MTFGSDKPKTVKTVQTKWSIRLNNGQYLDISANIVPVISGSVQRKALRFYDSQNIDNLVKSLDMADTIPTKTESSEIELLIGNDYYLDIILSQKIEVQPGLYLLASKLGRILTGRTHEIVANIEKAFLQIGIQPNQRDVSRFLWLKDSGETRVESDNIQEYRFCRVPIGLISSPFLLGATIESHLESFDNELALKLKNDIYVDNLITGADSIESAIQVYCESKSIFREASMNLRE